MHNVAGVCHVTDTRHVTGQWCIRGWLGEIKGFAVCTPADSLLLLRLETPCQLLMETADVGPA